VWKLLEKIFSPPRSPEQERVEHAASLAMADFRRAGFDDRTARRLTMKAIADVMAGRSRSADQWAEVECPRTGGRTLVLTPEGRFDAVRGQMGVRPNPWAEERWAKWAGQVIWDLYQLEREG
jgi:hypothetical protein